MKMKKCSTGTGMAGLSVEADTVSELDFGRVGTCLEEGAGERAGGRSGEVHESAGGGVRSSEEPTAPQRCTACAVVRKRE